MNNNKKNIWEKVFNFPSFNTRFLFTLIVTITIFLIIGYFVIFKIDSINDASSKMAAIGLIIQSATFILGIFAAYYALRQLVETRFTGLDEAGMQEIRRKHYTRASSKWKEALYIKSDSTVFLNLCESFLLSKDFDSFDQYVKVIESSDSFIKKEILLEPSDQIILFYLKSVRHLLVKNQGAAEINIEELINLVKNTGLQGFSWEFLDLQTSDIYQNLNGECKNMAENLILYLSQNISQERKVAFENKDFASQINPVV